ncbi:phosphatidylserine decarboxylase [Bacillus sp. V3B]|uniref:phosphatidylserine decarboxylase n=1 Tax=Bacillus sp. V3B TaxID=2804915 RepID=UPI00210B28E3|nr:phosphatidylserine decarboxylase [Bacillus sp. V3B]MCQ6273601.1 phosphatidylserine decarboxylase [Bacillus sp. V3B]
MIQTIYRLFIELTNRKSTSLMLAKFTKSKISRMLIPSFSKVYKINQAEMEKPIDEYATLHEFFTRKLKKGSRIVYQDSMSVVSPVDATIEEIGTVSSNYTMTVKGKEYTISEILGDDRKVEKYLNGTYMLFYLSPSNYHRIHSPISGKVTEQWVMGTKSYPVNKYGLKYGKKPFSKNYRMVTEMYYNNASIAIVKVGAMFINSIELLGREDELEKGDEIAYFSFGSSVVLFFEGGSFTPTVSKSLPCPIKVGECIGYINAESKTLVE